MSGTGKYRIHSRIENEPTVGIAPLLLPGGGPGPVIPSEPVRINGEGVWHLTQQGDTKIYQFSIAGFEYTGISPKKVVTATNTAEDNRLWHVHRVAHEEYVIALADDKALGWTVYGLGPDANIVVENLPPPNVQNETLPNPFYHLFKLTKLIGA